MSQGKNKNMKMTNPINLIYHDNVCIVFRERKKEKEREIKKLNQRKKYFSIQIKSQWTRFGLEDNNEKIR